MATLNEKLRQMQNQINSLEAKVLSLAKTQGTTRLKPESKVPLLALGKFGSPPTPSSGTGLGQVPGYVSGILWNDADASATPFGQQPPEPTKGYHKHGHSRYAGGALDISTIELVEYDLSGYNKHCQSFWRVPPSIKLDENGIEKISSILDNIVWDKENQVFRFYAVYKD